MRQGASSPLAVVATIISTIVLVLFIASLIIGPIPVDIASIWLAMFSDQPHAMTVVIREIRLPRSLLALTIGTSLGFSGAALQALVRNPLAEPGIIGVSALSALGAVIVFYTGLATRHALALPLGGIAGAMIAVAGLFLLAGRNLNTVSLILAGVAINSFAGALTALVLNLSPNPFAAYEIFFWLMGSLANRSFEHVFLALPLSVIGWCLILAARRSLDALVLGEDVAASLGVNVQGVRMLVVVGSALAVGAGVAVAGIVGFVGLVVPHLLRPLVGHSPRRLIPLSGLGGGALTLAADICTRVSTSTVELKLGVVTALLGAPFFLYLIIKTRDERQWT